jgi:hypothetical protein
MQKENQEVIDVLIHSSLSFSLSLSHDNNITTTQASSNLIQNHMQISINVS